MSDRLSADEAIRDARYRLSVELSNRLLWGDDDEQREFAEWCAQQPNDDTDMLDPYDYDYLDYVLEVDDE